MLFFQYRSCNHWLKSFILKISCSISRMRARGTLVRPISIGNTLLSNVPWSTLEKQHVQARVRAICEVCLLIPAKGQNWPFKAFSFLARKPKVPYIENNSSYLVFVDFQSLHPARFLMVYPLMKHSRYQSLGWTQGSGKLYVGEHAL